MDLNQQKSLQIDEVLKKIQDGELELVDYKGKSPAWTKFSKIRNVTTKACIELVQCKRCKVFRSFSKLNGTSTLNRHECKTENFNNAGAALDNNTFIEIREPIATEIKNIFIQKTMEACATDFIPADLVVGAGIKKLLQSAVSIGDKHGNVNVQSLFPSVVAVNRHMRSLNEDDQMKVEQCVKKVLKSKWCSSTVSWLSETNFNDYPSIIVSIKYFNHEITALLKKVVFTIPVYEHVGGDKLENDIKRKFISLGFDENDVHGLHVVTPSMPIFVQTFKAVFKRETCMAYTINEILKASFASCGGDIANIFLNGKEVVQLLMKTERITKLKVPINDDCTSWKAKGSMIMALNAQYSEIMNLLTEEEKAELNYNKVKAEQLMEILQVFIDAIEDLKSTKHPTCNKIVPNWFLLGECLNKANNYTHDVKKFILQTKSYFGTRYVPTMDQKIACFLDPRFRTLKMLPEHEREPVLVKVRYILCRMPVTATEPQLDNPPEPKKSRFSEFEATDADMSDKDEVNTYIYTTQLESYKLNESEFNLIEKFWKGNEKKFPKLFHLAMSRLHVSACCCSNYPTLTKKTVEAEELDHLLYARCRVFDIW